MTDQKLSSFSRRMTAASRSIQPTPQEGWGASRRSYRQTDGRPEWRAAPVPIWLAALMATRCQAHGNGETHAIGWECASGRALYTNRGAGTERIEPLGITLRQGETLEVYWLPGETAYTMNVSRWANRRCA
jgi:hypothetical protein